MELRTLGGLSVEGSSFNRSKPLTLVTYLALEGGRDRAYLAELFWPDAANPHGSLAKAVSQLRNGLPGVVREKGGHLAVEVDTDVAAFLAAVDAGREREALHHYGGPFLDGVRLSWSVELEEWIYARRESLAVRARRALLAQAEWEAARGAFPAAAGLAEHAYLLRGAPEPEPEDLERLHLLFRADAHRLATDVRKEAAGFGVELGGDEEGARAELRQRGPVRGVAAPNPYMGLAHYGEEDAQRFFGREAFTAALVAAVRRPPHLVAVVGASGSGKSSAVFAGLLPALRAEGGWRIAHARPGRRPWASLAAALMPLLEGELDEVTRLERANALAAHLREGRVTVAQVVERVTEARPGERVLLVLDQLEEAFTIAEAPDQVPPLLDQLLDAVRHPERRFTLVAALRADFLGAALEHQGLAQAMREAQHPLGPMREQELRAAIEQPASSAGVAFEAGLVERILRDVAGRQGALPLLAFALRELWDRQHRGVLTHAAYDAIGGVEDALANHATRVYRELATPEQTAAQAVLLQLVHPGSGHEDTRRVARFDEFGPHAHVVPRLAAADARLVVTGRDGTGVQTVEIAHEALIRRWDLLRGWLEEHRAFRTWQERLRQEVRTWRELDEDASALLRGFRLHEAERMLARHEAGLNEEERAFVRASQELRTRERTAERERREAQARARRERERLQRRMNAVLGAALAVALLLSGVAAWQWRVAAAERARAVAQRDEAERQVRLTLSRQLAAQALRAAQQPGPVNGHYDRALLLAAEASRLDADSAQSHANLLRVLQTVPGRLIGQLRGHDLPLSALAFAGDGRLLASAENGTAMFAWDVAERTLQSRALRGHEAEVRSVAFSPDGELIASGARDGAVLLWDAAAGARLGEALRGHEDEVLSVAFSPDGQLIASGGREGRIVLWSRERREMIGTLLREEANPVTSVAFAPGGRLLASGHRDNTVTLWDVPTRSMLGTPLRGHSDQVRSVAFAPDGETLASGARDGTVVLWDVAARAPAGEPLTGHTGDVRAVRFGPDGNVLASAGSDGLVILWDVERRRQLEAPLRGHTDEVRALAFGPGGRMLASGSNDATIVLWDVEDGTALGEPLTGHDGSVWSVDFSPDGATLASGSQDGTVRLWDVASLPRDEGALLPRAGEVLAVAFGPDGDLLATSGRDAAVTLWDAASGRTVGPPLRGHEDWVRALAFAPDGDTLASGGHDATVRLWRVDDGSPLGEPLRGHEDHVRTLAFGPEGTRLASGGSDGTVRLWDAASGVALGAPLSGHDDWVSDLAFHPGGELLASAGRDGRIVVWNLEAREPAARLLAHGGWVTGVAFDPSGRLLASGSRDGTIRLWDTVTWSVVGELDAPAGREVLSLAFAPGGQRLASGARDGSVTLWTVGLDALRSAACEMAGRQLAEEEWRRYLGGRAYAPWCGRPGADGSV